MEHSALFKNLQALEDASFPKACSQCGTQFENEKSYIQNTLPYQKSPDLTEEQDENGAIYLKLVRKCHCGKSILDHFSNRRDKSKQGKLRRQGFDKILKKLVEKGLSIEMARNELLHRIQHKKVMY